MSDLSTVMFATVKPKYFEPFYNFQSLLLNSCEEGSLATKSDVMQATRVLESKLMGQREICDYSKEETRSPEIESIFSGISCTEHRDGITLNILPSFAGGDGCSVCVKSNRTAVSCFTVNGAFSVELCSQALIYGDEKYSVGVMSANKQNGFAIKAGAGDSGIKGEVQLKVVCFDSQKYIIDAAEKYIDVMPFVKYIKG